MKPNVSLKSLVRRPVRALFLFPLLTVLENVCCPMEMNGVPAAQAKVRERTAGFRGNRGGEAQAFSLASFRRGAAARGDRQSAGFRREMEILRRLAHEDGYCVVVVCGAVSLVGRKPLDLLQVKE